SAALADLLYSRTEGNPFFVHQVVRTLTENGDIYREDGTWMRKEIAEIEVPETVRAVIAQRVGRLDQTAQDVLANASVLGQSFRVDDLVAMEQRSERDVEEGLDAAERIGLIKESDRGTYSFDHGLTQQALYSEIPSRRRRRLHRAAAAVMVLLPEYQREHRAAELAAHFLEGDLPEQAIPHAVIAGNRAEAVFAHLEAEQHYALALRLAREAHDEASIIQVCRKNAAPLHRSGRYQEALDSLERVAAVYEATDDLDNLVGVIGQIGEIHSDRGSAEEGLARLGVLLPRLKARPASSDMVYFYSSYCSLLFVVGRHAEHVAIARRTLQLAEELNDRSSIAAAKAQLGLALLSVRRREEARVALDDAIALAEKTGDLVTQGLALNNAAFLAEVWGEFDRSIGLSQRAFQLAQRLGDPSQTAFMATAMGRNHFFCGNWDLSRECHERAMGIGADLGESWVAPYLVLGYGQLLLALGDETEAEHAFQQGLALADANLDAQGRELSRQFLGELDLTRGSPGRAWERFREAGVTENWDPDRDNVSLPSVLVLAWASLELGRTQGAAALVTKIVEQARAAGEQLVLAEALCLDAILAARDGRPQESRDLFSQAVSLTRAIGYPYAQARISFEYGRAFPEEGATELQVALEIFTRLGARGHIERVRHQLALATGG
ncbi:MAG: ATP-binding protein, partial [Chloroflexota bacterium]